MYWRDETAQAWQAFWARLQNTGLSLPDLTAPDALSGSLTKHWLRPDLALSMTCSLPLRTTLLEKVAYVGTLDFGCDIQSGHYTSTILSNNAPPTRLALNSYDSQSGWGAVPSDHQRLNHIVTGSHAASLAAVADGRADVAYVDTITWRILRRFDENATRVRVLGETAPTPGLPLIAALGSDVPQLQQALSEVVADLPDGLRKDLAGLSGFSVLEEHVYLNMPIRTSSV